MAEGAAALPRGPGGRRGAALLALLPGLALILLLLLPGGGAGALAAERRLELTDFQFSALVAQDGSMWVRETLTARFQGHWNGLRREIPLLAHRARGREPLGLRLLSAKDGAGRSYRVQTRQKGDNLEWRVFVPNAEDATRTVVLRYRVANAVRFYPNHDEINWNVTGNAWDVPLEQVEARVWFPEGVKGLHASVYTGPPGSRGGDADLEIGEREVMAVSTRRLEAGEGLTLAVGFQKGLVTPAAAPRGLWGWLRVRLALLLPLSTAVILGWLWWSFGRDPAPGSVPVVYEPPDGLSAATLDSLVRQRVGRDALGATLVDLAVKGHLRIEKREHKQGILPAKLSVSFLLLTPPERWRELQAHERYLLARLFPSAEVGAKIDTERLRETFHHHVPGFETLVVDALLAKGVYKSFGGLRWPMAVRAATAWGALGFVAVVLVLTSILLPAEILQLQRTADQGFTGICLLLTLVLILAFAWIMPSRTPRGVMTWRKALGFLEFLRRVEAPRYKKVSLTPELFERFLPYAMAAGMTRSWTAAFAGIVQRSPCWYDDEGFFEIDNLGSSLNDCCHTISTSLRTSPGGSGSSDSGSWDSGSSGGGSSGGGDGGGGGGGF
ncbi:MAG: DUF2207 domain-containing protein [Cyanobacteriota bacterium]